MELGDAYYVYAFVDTNGNRMRDLGREDVLLLGEVVDTLTSGSTGHVITQRFIRGTLSNLRGGSSERIRKVVAAYQGLPGTVSPFCGGTHELANYRLPDLDGSFEIPVVPTNYFDTSTGDVNGVNF